MSLEAVGKLFGKHGATERGDTLHSVYPRLWTSTFSTDSLNLQLELWNTEGRTGGGTLLVETAGWRCGQKQEHATKQQGELLRSIF